MMGGSYLKSIPIFSEEYYDVTVHFDKIQCLTMPINLPFKKKVFKIEIKQNRKTILKIETLLYSNINDNAALVCQIGIANRRPI